MIPAPLALFNGSYLSKRPTGIGVVARELSNALDSSLVQVLDPFSETNGGSIPIPGNLMPDCGRKGHIRRLLWTQMNLPVLIRKLEARFLISPLPEAPILKGVRSIVLAHDLLPLRYPKISPLLAYHLTYVPLVLYSAERVLCNSEATAKEVHSRLGVSTKKLLTIPLGFNKKHFYPLGLIREPFFLVLGRHDPHKNLGAILKALSFLKDNTIQIYFVGPFDSRFTPKLLRLADEIGVSKRCKWIPWVNNNERLKLINTCQGLIIASLWEGFGLPALESMACNTPVIASNSGALPEVIDDAGLLINPKKPIEIAYAMKQLIDDSGLKSQLVERGKNRLKLYSWEKASSVIEELLLDLAK